MSLDGPSLPVTPADGSMSIKLGNLHGHTPSPNSRLAVVEWNSVVGTGAGLILTLRTPTVVRYLCKCSIPDQ
jgi:hypothetical protein